MPLLTKEQIQKRLKTDDADTAELLTIQATGLDYGKRGVELDSDEFRDDAQIDIEHTETLYDLAPGSVLRIFRAAHREGVKETRATKRSRRPNVTDTPSTAAP